MKKLRVGVEENCFEKFRFIRYIEEDLAQDVFENTKIIIDEVMEVCGDLTFKNCRVIFKDEGQMIVNNGIITFIHCEIHNNNLSKNGIGANDKFTINCFNTIIRGLEVLADDALITMKFYDSLLFFEFKKDIFVNTLLLYNSHLIAWSDNKFAMSLDLRDFLYSKSLIVHDSVIETLCFNEKVPMFPDLVKQLHKYKNVFANEIAERELVEIKYTEVII